MGSGFGGDPAQVVWVQSLLGGSWVVIIRVISRITILISLLRGHITPLITTHEPPSRDPKST